MKLSVVIVNYNVKYFLELCLHSVLAASKNLEVEIFVVDNCSTDGSRAYLLTKFPAVHFEWLSYNGGFAKANNYAVEKCRGNWILFLNPDTFVPEDCFEKCLAFVSEKSGCGALGVRMIDGSGAFLPESKRNFPSFAASFYKSVGLAGLFPKSKKFAAYYAADLPEMQVNKTGVLAGAFMMVRRDLFSKVGGFDERFFMYAEDIDLCYRLQKEGFSNYYFPQTTIVHFKGESTQRQSVNYHKNFYGAMHQYIQKHYPAGDWNTKLLHLSVSLAKSAALLQKRTGVNKKTHRPMSTLVVGTQEEFNYLLKILKHAVPSLLIAGRVGFAKNDAEPKTAFLQQMPEIARQNKWTQFIFCNGRLSFSDIIHEMQQIKRNTTFLFHAGGSESVVGSNSKNRNGIAIGMAEFQDTPAG